MADAEFQSELGRVHRTRPTESKQREVAWVETTFDGNHANRPLHVGIYNPNHASRSVCSLGFHTASELLDGAGCSFGNKTHTAAKKVLGQQPASHQVCIGDCWEVATSVTCGTGVCTGALRANL